MSLNRKEFLEKYPIPHEEATAFEQEAANGWEDHHTIYNEVLSEMDARIDARTSTVANKPRMAKLRKFIFLGIAAGVVALIAVVAYTTFLTPINNEKLFVAYFKPADNFGNTVRGEQSVSQPLIDKATAAYNEKDYTNAIIYYKQLLQSNPKDDKYLLFLGVSYLANNQPDQTIHLYNNSTYKNSPYAEDINWYLALAYIKKGDKNTAQLLLQNLTKSNSYYKVQAGELLNSL